MIKLRLDVESNNINDLIQSLQHLIDNDLEEWKNSKELPAFIIGGDTTESENSGEELLFDWSIYFEGE